MAPDLKYGFREKHCYTLSSSHLALLPQLARISGVPLFSLIWHQDLSQINSMALWWSSPAPAP